MDTPVLLLVYNRLETVKQVLDEILKSNPKKIYVSGDGPKADHQMDQAKVEKVREYILESIDGKIELHTLFHPKNLGVKNAVNKALEWFFSLEEKGIILEDDCVPVPIFFKYCEELLERYEDEKRIGMIAGRNEFGHYRNQTSGDYFLSTRGFVWGWATWRDRIENLDINIANKIGFSEMLSLFRNSSSFLEFLYRRKTIKDLKEQKVDTWDYQWSISLLLKSKYVVVPKENMITNIGFGENATHTFNTSVDSVNYVRDYKEIHHPQKLEVDKFYTSETIKKETGGLWTVLIPRVIVKIVRHFK